jgi:hypothetical protein
LGTGSLTEQRVEFVPHKTNDIKIKAQYEHNHIQNEPSENSVAWERTWENKVTVSALEILR